MRLSPLVAGMALGKTLVAVFVLCALAQAIFPGPQFSHMWLALFTAAPMGSFEMWFEGVVASLVVGFVTGYIFGWTYNHVSKKVGKM